MKTIYLDNNATTPLATEVLDAMQPYLRDHFGNPSSVHGLGQRAAHAIDHAREQVASLIGARPSQIVFTSGGTESSNLAIQGVLADGIGSRHLVTTAVEHPAVLEVCQHLADRGNPVTFVRVDRQGRLDLDQFESEITDHTVLASVMWANNETGVMSPIEEVARITSERGVQLHVDAVNAVGKIPIDLDRVPVDLLSASAHKLHGPKGVGALFVRNSRLVRPLFFGGRQERDMRPGTENVAGIVGFGAAAQLAAEAMDTWPGTAKLRDRLEQGICRRIPIAQVNGDPVNRLPNTSNIGFEALMAEAILLSLSEQGVCASSGSACSSGSVEPSHVLAAMGIDRRHAHGAIRFSLSRYTTPDEIDATLEILPPIIERLAGLMTA